MTQRAKVQHGDKAKLAVFIGMCAAAVTATEVQGSEFRGQIASVVLNTGNTGLARFSVEVGPHNTSCGPGLSAGFFAFEDADSGIGALWSAALVTAFNQRREVHIRGSGQCDDFNVEGISQIQVF